MRKVLNISNIYIFIWCIYNFHWSAQGIIPSIDRISNLLLGINLIISAYATIKVNGQHRIPAFFRITNILIFLFIAYGLVNVAIGDSLQVQHSGTAIRSGSYLIGPLRSFLPIYTFYLFTQMGYVTETSIKIWFPVFLVTSIYFFYVNLYVVRGSEDGTLLTNNSGYLFFPLFPCVYFFKKSWIQYLIVAALVLFSVMSLKRGAILATVICLLFFLYHKLKDSRRGDLFVVVILTAALLYLGISQVSKLYDESVVFQDRIEKTMEGNDSGRSRIRENLVNIYTTESGPFELLFGYGGNGTLRYGENYAHNDWLEMLFDMGIVGLCLFAMLWYQFFRLWRRAPRDTEVYLILGMMFLSQFAKTVFSMWYSDLPMFSTMLLGYCMSKMYIPHNIYVKR